MKKVLTKEEIKAIKEKHSDKKLYKGSVSWEDETKETHSIEFIYRRPTVADMEMMQKQAVNNATVAQMNLFRSLCVSDKASADILSNLHKVVDGFLSAEVMPFFGSKVETKSEAL